MSNQLEQLAQFIDLTAASEDRARFFLESSGWQLEVALASFFETDNDMEEESIEVDPERASPVVQPPSVPEPPPKPLGSKKSKSKTKSQSSSGNRVRTLASLRQDSEDSDSGNEEGQAFYAGGSDSSGQQILGPSKNKNKPNREEFVQQMFKSVKEHGAEIVDPHGLPSGGAGPSTSSFGGRGYRLGQTPDDIEEVTAGGSSSRQPPQVDVTLKMWREGFTVNDGSLRNYSDPENKEFLECIRRGEVPRELIREARGSEVHVNMEDHSHEQAPPYKPKVKAFAGKGNVLGSPVPTTNTTSVVLVAATDGKTKEQCEEEAKKQVPVDASQPSTTIQVRLTDGSAVVIQLNHTHTVGDLRRYITIARPQYATSTFSLHTTFPRKEMTDDAQSVKDAGLLNAAVLQRLG